MHELDQSRCGHNLPLPDLPVVLLCARSPDHDTDGPHLFRGFFGETPVEVTWGAALLRGERL